MHFNRATVAKEVTPMVKIPSMVDILCSFIFLHFMIFSQSLFSFNDSSYNIAIISSFPYIPFTFFYTYRDNRPLKKRKVYYLLQDVLNRSAFQP